MNKSNYETLDPIARKLHEALTLLEYMQGAIWPFYPDNEFMPREDDISVLDEMSEGLQELVPQIVAEVQQFIGGAR